MAAYGSESSRWANKRPTSAVDLVDELDLGGLGFDRVEPRETGRPSYHPSVLLKLCVYGYLNRVQSSRRLEREAGRNVEVMCTSITRTGLSSPIQSSSRMEFCLVFTP